MASAWSVGDRVRLWDVKKAEYNNKEGTIKGKYNRRKKRWPVELDFNGKTVNVEAKNLRKGRPKKKEMSPPEIMDKAAKKSSGKKKKGKSSKKKKKKLEVGNRVKLVNVTKKAYEGKMGTITGDFNDRKKRWPVTLDEDGKKVNLKPENLELVEEEAKAEAGFGAGSETALDDDSANSQRNEAIIKCLEDALNEACESIRETHSIDFDERQALDMLQEHFQNHDKKAKKADPAKQDYIKEGDTGSQQADEEVKEEEAKEEEVAAAAESPKEDENKAPNQANDPDPTEKAAPEPAAAEEEVKAAEDGPSENATARKVSADMGDFITKLDPNSPRNSSKFAGGEELPSEGAPPPGNDEEQRSEEEPIDFGKYAKLLPVARTHEETQKRHEMFSGMDQSDNGQLSLAEIEVGIKNYIGEEIYLMKPAIKMAYKAARGIAPEEDHDDDAFVDFQEFRIFLSMVRQYIELYAAFDAIDSGEDNRISIKEFKSATEMLAEWGIKVDDPEKTFSEIDTNGGGQVLFEEFCRWAMNKHLDYDKDFDGGDNKAKLQEVEIEEDQNEYKPYEKEDSEDEQRSEDSIDLAKFAAQLPVGRTHDETQKRHKMFNDIDTSGNGQLSLAEIELGMEQIFGPKLDFGDAIKEAYKASRGIDPNGDGGDQYVSFSEFRILMVCMRQYIQLNAAFDAMDSENDDRINFEEFSTSLDMLREWGVEIGDPQAEFDSIDANDGGQILFAEFCQWAMKKGLDYDEDLQVGDGKARRQSVSVDDTNEYKPYEAPKEKKKDNKKKYEVVELDVIAKKLPVGRTNEEAIKRKKMFDAMDSSGNDQLSLAEIDLGILNELGEEFHLMKPAIRMAYKSSRGVDPGDEMANSFVEFSEFRILLCNIRRYIELFAAFEAVDDGDDNRIEIDEFKNSLDMLKEWGIKVDNPEETFASIDENGGGQVLFNEFASWALKNGLDYDSDVDEGDANAVHQEVDVPDEPEPVAYEEKPQKKKYEVVELDEIAKKLPVGRSNEEAVERKKMFDAMDASGNDQLSLAEIDLGILNVLGEEFHLMKPAIRMAYKSSRGVDPGDEMANSFVEFSEFRILLCNIRRYIELFAAFEAVDDGDDNRIELAEFKTSLDMLKDWGITVDNPEETFASIDENGGGQVLFNEFAAWALKNGLDYDSDVDEGDANAVHQEVDVPDEPEPAGFEEEVEAKEEIKVEIDFDAMTEKLPTGDSKADKKERKAMFQGIDQSGNGQLSLAEIELGVLNYLGEDAGMLKTAIRMAYKVAKEGRGGSSDDYVERKEMKTLLICLQRYFELWAAFEAVDTGDDHRIDFDEFSKAVTVLEKWNVEIDDPKAEFDAMDSNDGGQALFGEFCAWALKKNLEVDDEEDTSDAEEN